MNLAAIIRAWFSWRSRHRRTAERARRDAQIARDESFLKDAAKHDPRRGAVRARLSNARHARMREAMQ